MKWVPHVLPFRNSPSFLIIPSLQWFLKIIWSTSGSSKKNWWPYSSNMGMTAKSHSNKLFFLQYLSLYRSRSLDNCCQNIVSKSLIFLFPQIFHCVQSRKQSLICLDICRTNGKKKKKKKKKHKQKTKSDMCIWEPFVVVF